MGMPPPESRFMRLGEFPLLGLAGFAAFCRLAGKQHQVDVVIEGIIE